VYLVLYPQDSSRAVESCELNTTFICTGSIHLVGAQGGWLGRLAPSKNINFVRRLASTDLIFAACQVILGLRTYNVGKCLETACQTKFLPVFDQRHRVGEPLGRLVSFSRQPGTVFNIKAFKGNGIISVEPKYLSVQASFLCLEVQGLPRGCQGCRRDCRHKPENCEVTRQQGFQILSYFRLAK